MRKYTIIGVLSLLVLVVCCIDAFAGFSDDYTHNQDFELYNGGTQTIQQPLTLDSTYFNLTNLIAYNFIQPNAADITIDYLGIEEYLTAMDLSGSPVIRTEYTSIPVGDTIKKTIWFGNSSGTRNQPWIGSSGDTNAMSGTQIFFSRTESFAIRCDITPAVAPGTRQTILGVQDSYLLSYDPGPMYRWYCYGSGAFNASATLTATVNQQSRLVAWHNGSGGEIMLCDTLTGSCCQTAFSDLVLGGTLMPPITMDCIIDDLSVRVPDFPASGTPPGAPGTPPAMIAIVDQDYECLPVHNTICGEAIGYYTYFKLDCTQPHFAIDTNTTRYAMQFYRHIASTIVFRGIYTDLSYWADDQLLTWVAPSVTLKSYCNQADYYVQLKAELFPENYVWEIHHIGTVAYGSTFTVSSGSSQVNPDGISWTIDDLRECDWYVSVVTYPIGDDSPCGTYREYDCDNPANDDMYVINYEVEYQVAP